MRFLITTDGATKVVKDCSEDEARVFQAQGFEVQRLNDDDSVSPLDPEPAPEEVATAAAVVPKAAKVVAKKAPAAKKAPPPAPPVKTAKKRR